jgi:hypothetical protein
MPVCCKAVSLALYFTSFIPLIYRTTTATFADDTAVLATDPDPTIASHKLQASLLAIQHCLTKWRLKANGSKSTHVTFTTCRATCPPVHIYNEQLSQAEEVNNLGLHLDRRLTWHKHIFAKWKHFGITLTKLYWLLGRKSRLSMSNKLILYKVILKPIWTYSIQFWGSAFASNIEILESFQSKALHMIADVPWYVPNVILRQDLQIPSVKGEIRLFSINYSSRLQTHPNSLAVYLTEPPEHGQLKTAPANRSNHKISRVNVCMLLK